MTGHWRSIDYGTMMHDAMRGLIARVLRRVAEEGLPGNHHFFISFDTNHAGVRIADWLHERYPEDMTIVLQHEVIDLKVRDDGFEVTLSFGDKPEVLVIPWSAMKTFVDPSVEFGFRFEGRDDDGPDDPGGLDEEAPFAELEEEAEPPRRDAEVVSLDRFRK